MMSNDLLFSFLYSTVAVSSEKRYLKQVAALIEFFQFLMMPRNKYWEHFNK